MDVTFKSAQWIHSCHSHVRGATNNRGRNMKLRAITLAAAGLLAAASAQAELQTWRFSGLAYPGTTALFGEYAQFDLTFDLGVDATDGVFASALIAMSLNGAALSVGANQLAWDGQERWSSTLTADLTSPQNPQGATLRMTGPAGTGAFDEDGVWRSTPVSSVGDFLTKADAMIDDVAANLVFAEGYTWQEAVKQEFIAAALPSIGLFAPAGAAQSYVLIGAHNITPGVPEPSAWTLVLVGGVGALAMVRRRQASTAQVA